MRPSKEWLRGFGKLFHCPLCFGFHAGWFLFVINEWTELFTFDYSPVTGLFLGCLGSLVSYIFATVFDDHGIKIDYN